MLSETECITWQTLREPGMGGHHPVSLLKSIGYQGTFTPAEKNSPSIESISAANHSEAVRRRTRTRRRRGEASMFEQNQLPSFEKAVLPHLDAAYNLARWLMRNEQDAQDVAQEAYLRAFRFYPGFRGGDARAWLLKIVRNTCYSWLHANRPLQEAAEFDENLFPPDSCGLNPEEAVLQNDSNALLRKALEKLQPNYREVLILRELEGMSYKEIADITGMPAGTVMSSLSRARGQLRQILTSAMKRDTAPSSRRIVAVNA
jgi:RNA polymerase sigma-70 factor (ECF subfamily)